MGHRKVIIRGKFIALQGGPSQETRKSSNKLSNLHLKELEKEQQIKPKVSNNEGNNKDQSRNK